MKQFLRDVFSSSESASWSRVGSFMALTAGIVWVTRIVWAHNSLPDLLGLTAFVVGLYTVGKAADTIRGMK